MKKQILTHVGIVVALFAVACIYLSPALSGKIIRQGDIQKSDAMSYAQRMEKQQTGTIPNWAESMFSGMPGYQIACEPVKTVFRPIKDAAVMHHLGLERNIGVIFLYLLGFYVALLAFGLSPWLALVGALGFGLASYNIIIIEAGHITKAWAMSMMAPIMAGLFLVLKTAVDDTLEKRTRITRTVWGALLFTFALILQLSYNHIQIVFYTAVGCGIMAIAYLIYAIIRRRIVPLALSGGILVVCVALAFGCCMRSLLVNEEYVRHTMRGGNELTVTPADLYGAQEQLSAQNTSTGLNIDYAFSWSYGVGETYTLLVPGAMGGGSGEKVSKESAFYKTFRSTQAPLYWGNQPFTSGPVYFGAVVLLLFAMGLMLVKGPEKWWLLVVTLLAVLLSWGHNLMGFNEWVFNHVPFYNKFRTPSMALVLANVCVALMAALTLKELFSPKRNRQRVNLALYIGGGALAVLILGVLVASSSFDFSGSSDQQMAAQYGNNWDMIKSVLVSDRAALLRSDSWRSLLFIVLTVAVLWLYNNEKIIKKSGIAIAAIGLLVVVDLWGVDRRYLNNDNFTEKRSVELRRDQWDYDIDQLAAQYGDHDYRVLNLAVNTYNDSKPSAFHNQVGGYSAAKLSRYQNLIDFYLSRHIKPEVLAMLNTRYVVLQNGQVQRLPDSQVLGNAWFVTEVKAVGSADEEILTLNTIDPATTAVIDTSKWKVECGKWKADSLATIVLEQTKPHNSDYRRYTTHSSQEQLAVFSEIHYAPDWFAYIDGQPADYVCANYVLRAMVVPAGDHVIEFKNEAPRLHKLDTINLIFSIVTLLAMVGAIALLYIRKKETK